MMVGWWAVCNWSGDEANRVHAKRQATGVLNWLQRHRYRLYQPDGTLVPRGDNAWFAGGSLKRIVEMMGYPGLPPGLPHLPPDGGRPVVTIPAQDIPFIEDIPTNEYWKPFRDFLFTEVNIISSLLGFQFPEEIPEFTDEMSNSIAATAMNNQAGFFTFLRPFEKNLVLLATAFNPGVRTDAFNHFAATSDHLYALLLRRATLDERSWWRPWQGGVPPGQVAIDLSDRAAEAQARFDSENQNWANGASWVGRFRHAYLSCPTEGPFASVSGEWVKRDRWEFATERASETAISSMEEYSGLDFLGFELLLRMTNVHSVFE